MAAVLKENEEEGKQKVYLSVRYLHKEPSGSLHAKLLLTFLPELSRMVTSYTENLGKGMILAMYISITNKIESLLLRSKDTMDIRQLY